MEPPQKRNSFTHAYSFIRTDSLFIQFIHPDGSLFGSNMFPLTLEYDYKEGKNKNVPGLETRVPGWGDTETVEFIDPRLKHLKQVRIHDVSVANVGQGH